MKMFIHLKRSLWLLVLLFPSLILAQSRKKGEQPAGPSWNYELEAVGVAKQGYYQVKIWSYVRDPNDAQQLAMKNAVHGIIFKGFPDKERIKGQRPLAQSPNLEVEQAPFFETFFMDNGKYLKYVSLVDNGAIEPGNRIKVGKDYKIGLVVTVHVAALRKDLEEAGIIKALSDGF